MRNLHFRAINVNNIAFLLNFKTFYFILVSSEILFYRLPLADSRQRFFLRLEPDNRPGGKNLPARCGSKAAPFLSEGKTGLSSIHAMRFALSCSFMPYGKGV